MNKVIVYILFSFAPCILFGQFKAGTGFTYGVDLYKQFTNPHEADKIENPVNSVLLNFNIGPKVWVGFERFSLSLEGWASYAPFAYSYGDYKGLGALSFPVMAQLQFGGLSGFSKTGGFGVSIGGGMEWSHTDLYFIEEDLTDVDRSFYDIPFGQIAFGLGYAGYAIQLYGRYGKGDMDASNFSIGIVVDQNLTHFKKLEKENALP